jgi:hypothetical protein
MCNIFEFIRNISEFQRISTMNQANMQAISFLKNGIAVFPIRNRDKRPEFTMLPIDPVDNKPTWEPYKTQLPTINQVNDWFSNGLENYAVVSGWQNLVILDFDDAQEYTRWTMWTRSQQIASFVFDHALKVRTSRGVHVYIRTATKERARKIGKIDIKAAGGYVLGPGSIHPHGETYTSINPKFIFPLVDSLSDVLPANLLIQDPTVQTVKQQPVQNLDPWARASAPQILSTPGADLIQKIRGKYKIEDFLPQTTQTGTHWLMTCCPFHQDAHPSFWIDTARQICGCHAGCTPKPLDVINLIARLHSISNHEAIIYLAQNI